jgi:hypothetical protein
MWAASFPLRKAVEVRCPLPNTANDCARELARLEVVVTGYLGMLHNRSRYLASAGTASSDAECLTYSIFSNQCRLYLYITFLIFAGIRHNQGNVDS